MFREWGFLISEMIVLIVLAALLGLLVGWLIWGRRSTQVVDTSQTDRLRRDLQACQALQAEKSAEISALQGQIASATTAPAAALSEVSASDGDGVDYDGDGVIEGEAEGVKPVTLSEARDGKADDLKQIKGIGPKLEKLCNSLGIYHFDQIAGWSADEEAWVNANLEGFKGRVSRDQWIAQAKVLAAGGETEFSKRVEGGDVY
ncbi:MAG: hypothetical protein WBC85_02465 [Planktotalea sp.]|uniref:hypothetical protein n=1 Tax=Planktotalea sp. TaxID=2029877 RepID=UPI003C789F58